MKKKQVNLKVLFSILLQICLLTILLGYSNLIGNELVLSDNWIVSWSWISVISLIWQCGNWIFLTKQWFSPYIIFVLSSYSFHLSQLVLIALGCRETLVLDIFNMFDEKIMFFSVLFVVICMHAWHLGGLITLFFKEKKVIIREDKKINDLVSIKKVGLLLIAICSLPFFIYHGELFYKAFQGGYLETYNLSSLAASIDSIAMLYKPAIIFLIVGYKKKTKISNSIFIGALLFTLLKMFITGGRGTELIFIVSLFWLRHILIKRITKKNFFIYLVILLSLLSLMSFIGTFRLASRNDLSSINEAFSSIIDKNPVISTLGEFGTTIQTLALMVERVPEKLSYGYGQTYVNSFVGVALNGLRLTNYYLNMSNIQYLLDVRYIGGSFIAEFYYNFGQYGWVLACFFGGIFSLYSNMAVRVGKEGKYIGCVLSTIFLYIVTWIVREQFVGLIMPVVMQIIFPYFLYQLIIKKEVLNGKTSIECGYTSF